MGEYRSQEIRDIFGISHETVRRWALEYQEYLSEGAKPNGVGKHRIYNDDDLRVFAFIKQGRDQNYSDDEIHLGLKSGQKGDFPSIENQSLALSTNLQLGVARQEIANLQAQLEEALEWRDKAKQYEGEIKQLREQIESFKTGQADVIGLHKEIARLTVLLEIAKGKSE